VKLVIKGVLVAGLLALALGVILPEPLAILICGPFYKYCGVLCC
jgi:hypothetical protein